MTSPTPTSRPPSDAGQEVLAIIARAVALWQKSADNYECSAPHDTGSKAACVAARDALQFVERDVRAALARRPVEEPGPPSQAWLPDTFIERAYRAAQTQSSPLADLPVTLTVFEAGAIRGFSRGVVPPPAPSERLKQLTDEIIAYANAIQQEAPTGTTIFTRAGHIALCAARLVPPPAGDPKNG